MNPSIDKVVQNLREQEGMHVDLKKKLADGTYDHASDKDLSLLNSQTMLLSAAQNFKDMDFDAKLKAAIDLKNRGNKLFQNGDYPAALELYLQALTASEFGGSKNNNNSNSDENSSSKSNIDELVVPVLCNMAACTLKMGQFVKAARFCDEALQLRPRCLKALQRRGFAFLQLKEYDLSVASLEQAKALLTEGGGDSAHGTAADRKAIERQLLLARQGRKEERQRLKTQRENLQRAFGTSQSPAPSEAYKEAPVSAISELWTTFLNWLLWIIDTFVVGLTGKPFLSKSKNS